MRRKRSSFQTIILAAVVVVTTTTIAAAMPGCRSKSTTGADTAHIERPATKAPGDDASAPRDAHATPGASAGAGAAAKPDAARSDADHDRDQLHLDVDTLRDLRITIVAVETRTTVDTLTLLGELRVNEDAYAEVSAPLSARVTRLLAAAGDVVRQGQPLVLLHSREIGDAISGWQSASARVTLARQALDRRRALAAERITPQRSVEEAAAELAAAEAAQRAAGTTLVAIGVPTSQLAPPPSQTDAPSAPDTGAPSGVLLRTPIAGTVLDRTVAVGQLADPARPLFRIADLRTLWLTVHAFERDAVRLSPRAAVRVRLAALPGETFDGTIARIGQQVDPVSRTVSVRIDLPNAQRRLKPGMSASAAVPIGANASERPRGSAGSTSAGSPGDAGGRPVLTVPAAALQRIGERWCVFIPAPQSEGPGRFRIRAVARGRDLDGEVEILDGLSAGDRVVSDGAFVLKAEVDKRAGAGDAHAH